jgi:hypothetical protein
VQKRGRTRQRVSSSQCWRMRHMLTYSLWARLGGKARSCTAPTPIGTQFVIGAVSTVHATAHYLPLPVNPCSATLTSLPPSGCHCLNSPIHHHSRLFNTLLLTEAACAAMQGHAGQRERLLPEGDAQLGVHRTIHGHLARIRHHHPLRHGRLEGGCTGLLCAAASVSPPSPRIISINLQCETCACGKHVPVQTLSS